MNQFNVICILFFTIIFECCSTQNESFISEEIFIPLYANVLIINQLDIDKEYHDILIAELLQEYKVKVIDIQNTIEYYQNNPDLWVNILEKVKNHFIKLKKNQKPDTKNSKKIKEKDNKLEN